MNLAVHTLMRLPRTRSLRTWFFFDEVHALHRLPAIKNSKTFTGQIWSKRCRNSPRILSAAASAARPCRMPASKIVVDAATLSVVGITEVFSKLPGILSGMAAARSYLKNTRPDLLILIDFPDFNLRMAAIAKKLRIPVLFYISPQIWAWRSGRVTKIAVWWITSR